MYVYCKAYHLRDLRAFSGWREIEEGDAGRLADASIAYILDDFTVVVNPFQHTSRLFVDVTEAWKEFCRHTLHFERPAELHAPSSTTESSDQLQK